MSEHIVEKLKKVIQSEADALSRMAGEVSTTALSAVEALYGCNGLVVTTGLGKSAFIAQKFAATLTSTGSPAFYLHPSDALHGDIGIVGKCGLCVVFSNSGETQELLNLIPLVKNLGVRILCITGRKQSSVARIADIAIATGITSEADQFNLIPTTSAIGMLALTDAMAIAVMDLRGFSQEDYARVHPSGTIGRKLHWRVADCMHTRDQLPAVRDYQTVADAVLEITKKRLGATLVLNEADELVGIFTDGDLRRLVQSTAQPLSMRISSVMTTSPQTTLSSDSAAAAATGMRARRITVLPVLDTAQDRRPVGIVHFHDLITAGLIEPLG